MEVIQQALSLFGSSYGPLIAAAIGGVTLLFKMIKALFKASDFHDKHLVRKHLQHLKAIRSSVSSNPELKKYLDEAIQREAFRLASGISTSRAKMEFLFKLSNDGVWTRQQLRRVSKFLIATPGELEPSITLSWADLVGAGLGITTALSMVLVGTLYLAQHVFQGGLIASWSGWPYFQCALPLVLSSRSTLSTTR